MEFIIVCFVALLASGLTLFSGFGLGTLLLPAFLAFFPVDLAIAMTAIVHFLNNVFKLVLVGRNASARVALRFGIPAIVAAFGGAAVLLLVADIDPIASFEYSGRVFHISPVKLLMAILITGFAFLEVLPSGSGFEIDQKYIPLGGLLSGFFGGLSGHQGALRSAFLIKAGLSRDSFIATGVVIACFVDATRLTVYAQHFAVSGLNENIVLISAATLCAFLGAFVGNKLLKQITLRAIQVIVSILLLVVALGLGVGLL